MNNKIRWGLDNPHPFSQIKMELIWEGKYDEYGSRIRQDILKEKRAKYGKEIVATLSRQLIDDYGNNFNEKNLRRMIQFAEVFSDMEIVVTLSRQLSWSHFVAILPLKDDLQRDFYAEMCRVERWSRNFTKPLKWHGNGWRQGQNNEAVSKI